MALQWLVKLKVAAKNGIEFWRKKTTLLAFASTCSS